MEKQCVVENRVSRRESEFFLKDPPNENVMFMRTHQLVLMVFQCVYKLGLVYVNSFPNFAMVGFLKFL